MICYKDMTFCHGDGCQNFNGCRRALTKEVKEKAKEFGLPICFFKSPHELDCYEGLETTPPNCRKPTKK